MEGLTPAQVVGIENKPRNKWFELIRNSHKSDLIERTPERY